jgi:hypothetical protein
MVATFTATTLSAIGVPVPAVLAISVSRRLAPPGQRQRAFEPGFFFGFTFAGVQCGAGIQLLFERNPIDPQ